MAEPHIIRRPPPFSAWRVAVSLVSAAAYDLTREVYLPPGADAAEVARAVGWIAGQMATSPLGPAERVAWLRELGHWAAAADPRVRL